LGATDYFFLQQIIEGLNVADLAWGTANASTVTLSFWVRSSLTGTFGGCIKKFCRQIVLILLHTVFHLQILGNKKA
jgi:hypothetical protein